MDNHDRLILCVLEMHEEYTIEEMSKKLHKPVDAIWYSIALEKNTCGPWVMSKLNAVITEEEL